MLYAHCSVAGKIYKTVFLPARATRLDAALLPETPVAGAKNRGAGSPGHLRKASVRWIKSPSWCIRKKLKIRFFDFKRTPLPIRKASQVA